MGRERPPDDRRDESLTRRLSRWARSPWIRRLETAVLVGLVAFALYRFGPQLSALTGVGGREGATPDFTVTTLGGDTLSSEDLRGRVVVVNFWATWCPPCRFEIPSLQKLHERRSDDDVVVLGLSTDEGPVTGIRTFLEERSVTYPVARADRATRTAFGGITGIPTTVLLDRSGRIRHRIVGYFVPPALNAAVNRLLDSGSEADTACTALLGSSAASSSTGSFASDADQTGDSIDAALEGLCWRDGSLDG